MLQFVGCAVLAPHNCYAPVRQTDVTRRQWLQAYAARLHHSATEQPLEVGDY